MWLPNFDDILQLQCIMLEFVHLFPTSMHELDKLLVTMCKAQTRIKFAEV
jgi:hypothetical protein